MFINKKTHAFLFIIQFCVRLHKRLDKRLLTIDIGNISYFVLYLDKMKYFVEIFLYIIILFHKSQQNDLSRSLKNDGTPMYDAPNSNSMPTNQNKREKSEIDPTINHASAVHEECDGRTINDKFDACLAMHDCK